MKSFRIDEEKYLSDQEIMTAILNASRGKRNRKDVQKVLRNLDYYVPKIRKMILTESYHPRHHGTMTIQTDHKPREITKPDFYPEQIVHHILVDAFKDALMDGMIENSFGSIPFRGCKAGMEKIKKWIRDDPKGTRYVFQGDVHHFFQSVDHELLINMITKKIRPCHMRNIWIQVINEGGEGLPIGFYTSQWNGNFYLTALDHFILSLDGVDHYARYMDDVVVFGRNKKKLHKIQQKVDSFLWNNLHLCLKSNWQVYPLEYVKNGQTRGRQVNIMGFKFYRSRTVLRPSIAYSGAKYARNISRLDHWNRQIAASVISFKGWYSITDTYTFFETYVKPYVSYRHVRKFLSRHPKKNDSLRAQAARMAIADGQAPETVQEYFRHKEK